MTKGNIKVKKGGQSGPTATTPLRAALVPNSHLVPLVRDGIQAVEKGHRDYFEEAIRTVIKKRQAALGHLKGHLKNGKRVHAWIWVASGKVHFPDVDKQSRMLAQNGIEFAGKMITAKLLARV